MKSDIPEEKLSEMRKQAYLDAHNSRLSNLDKHRNFADPILQGNSYYKKPEYKEHIESKNYYSHLSSKNEQEPPKVQRLPNNKENLDEKLIDVNPLPPAKTKSKTTLEYEERLSKEHKERLPIKKKIQDDNVFNFNEPEKGKEHFKKFEGQFPSDFYTRESNRKTNYIGNHLPSKIYGEFSKEGRKDVVKNFFEEKDLNKIGNNDNQGGRRNVKKTEVEEIFERGKNYLPVRYQEPTPIPGKVEFDSLKEIAVDNIPNIRKNGRKYRGKEVDFDL